MEEEKLETAEPAAAKKAVEWVTVNGGKITGIFAGFEPPEDAVVVCDNFGGCIGDPLEWYDKNWKRMPVSKLVADGKLKLEKGFVLEGETIRAMSQLERLAAGVEEPPEGMVYDKRINNIREKTDEEKHADGDISDEEYNEILVARKREERDAALSATDKYMRPDFPISEEERELVIEYSQWLRDLPTLPEFSDMEIPTVEEWLKNKKG